MHEAERFIGGVELYVKVYPAGHPDRFPDFTAINLIRKKKHLMYPSLIFDLNFSRSFLIMDMRHKYQAKMVRASHRYELQNTLDRYRKQVHCDQDVVSRQRATKILKKLSLKLRQKKAKSKLSTIS